MMLVREQLNSASSSNGATATNTSGALTMCPPKSMSMPVLATKPRDRIAGSAASAEHSDALASTPRSVSSKRTRSPMGSGVAGSVARLIRFMGIKTCPGETIGRKVELSSTFDPCPVTSANSKHPRLVPSARISGTVTMNGPFPRTKQSAVYVIDSPMIKSVPVEADSDVVSANVHSRWVT